jgi:hypothetical protein
MMQIKGIVTLARHWLGSFEITEAPSRKKGQLAADYLGLDHRAALPPALSASWHALTADRHRVRSTAWAQLVPYDRPQHQLINEFSASSGASEGSTGRTTNTVANGSSSQQIRAFPRGKDQRIGGPPKPYAGPGTSVAFGVRP